jgi:hypothetical protein
MIRPWTGSLETPWTSFVLQAPRPYLRSEVDRVRRRSLQADTPSEKGLPDSRAGVSRAARERRRCR